MDEKPNASSPVNRIVIVLGIVAIIGIIGYCVIGFVTSVKWSEYSFKFTSGPYCIVFPEPKLTIFVGDGGTDELFDHVNGHFHDSGFTVNLFTGICIASGSDMYRQTRGGRTILQFWGGKGSLVVSHNGTKLTLADGQEFTLDGKTPLWLRCKSDGTIVQLDELPEGFVQFFESPPPDPGYIGEVKSYPEAFR